MWPWRIAEVIALIQRVDEARVDVEGETVGAIAVGLLALIGVQPGDDATAPRRLLDRLLDYRIFPDAAGRMNRSLRDVGGGLLLVPQFTLAADTRSGLRPSFSTAASPTLGQERFDTLVEIALVAHAPVATGQFGADMRVRLVNNGPVTFWLEV
jgi:D-tyrosyl-tRNA(Tyr) deacylase